jgi:alanyl-tRNA synthetase
MGELKETRDRVEALERELAGLRVRALAASTPPDADGVCRVLQTGLSESASLLRGMAQVAGGTDRLIPVLVAAPAILVGAGPGSGLDAGRRLKALLTEAGGRGGGNATVAQGTVPDPARLDGVARELMMGANGLQG